MASADEQPVHAGDGAELAVLRDRDRLAGELRNEVIQRIFAVGLSLESAAALAEDPAVRDRIAKAVSDLDYVIRVVRDAVFALEARLQDHGLRARIMRLSERFPAVPDVNFRGPVDGALDPSAGARLLEVLDEAAGVIGERWAPFEIDVEANDGDFVTVIRAVPLPVPAGVSGPDHDLAGLHASAAQAGIRIEIEARPEATQFAWRIG
jgi:two-component system, NarL family, sensor histidine kinase DevS